MLRATTPYKTPQLLGASAVAVSHTGDTNETALATVSIPAGAMGTNGGIEVNTVWTITSSGNNKTLRVRLGGIGGTGVLGAVLTAVAQYSDSRRVRNRNSASSQVVSAGLSAPAGGLGSTAAAVATAAVDTSTAKDLVISAQLANSSETITLEMYEVWLLPA